MIYLKEFDSHSSYETELSVGGADISLPNVSYCKDVKDVHYTPYNLVRFYVGDITPPKTVKIYTDSSTSIDVTVSEGNKWYSYMLPKDKGLYRMEGYSVKKVVVKADITTSAKTIIPLSTVEASFKGSNTSNVTSMASMFEYCRSLTSLDVSSFDTSNVTDMGSMFDGCSNLTSLDVSSFDTSNVTDMSLMFYDCNGLTSLDVNNFDTSKVTNMGDMFYNCSSITSLNLSNFNTSNVINMGYMFGDCTSLTFLDLSGLDMSNVTNMSYMFDGCGSLETIRMVGCLEYTINNITAIKPSSATIVTE